jgi:hypothetical protein
MANGPNTTKVAASVERCTWTPTWRSGDCVRRFTDPNPRSIASHGQVGTRRETSDGRDGLPPEGAMNSGIVQGCIPVQFELRFFHLFCPGRWYSFPCDAQGCVDLDSLSESLRNNYLFARALVGHELSAPVTWASHSSIDPGH